MRKLRPTSTRNMDYWRDSRQFDRISMGSKDEQFDMRELILTKNRRFCTPPTCAASLLGSLLFELAVSCRGRFAHTRAVPVNGTGKGGAKGTYKRKLYPTSTPPAPIKGEGGTNIYGDLYQLYMQGAKFVSSAKGEYSACTTVQIRILITNRCLNPSRSDPS
jgi:hypothetical protein